MLRQNLPKTLTLLFLGICCTLAIVIVHHLTQERIAANLLQEKLKIVNAVLPIHPQMRSQVDSIVIEDTGSLDQERAISVYRRWVNDEPFGIALMPIEARGYSGKILLVIGIQESGSIRGIQVLGQQETKGIGDQVHQDKSDWLEQFKGYSLTNTQTEDWSITDAGGRFDGISGATITSRGVIDAIHKTLEFYAIRKESLYSKY